jgi:D-sedoheptulose 7-phosphate isomerase
MVPGKSLAKSLSEAMGLLDECRRDPTFLENTERFAEAATRTLERGGRLFACGNGGSMSDAMHFTEELVGRFREIRPALSAMTFSDPATMTCIANDFGFEHVFARQVQAHGRPDDLLVTLSTSGESENLILAARSARERGLQTVALLGRGGGKLASEADVSIIVPEATTPERIQEIHLLVLHAVIETIEANLVRE